MKGFEAHVNSMTPFMLGLNRQHAFVKVYGEIMKFSRERDPVEPPSAKTKELEMLEKTLADILHPKNPLWPGFYILKGGHLPLLGDPGWSDC